MNRTRTLCIIVGLVAWSIGAVFGAERPLPKTTRMLSGGRETVRIVCFGDSITGVYYHTGGRRAWTDMLGIALQRLYPKAKLQMINAGISGHTTVNGLARIQKDVLAKKPHLVVVMFGMNDVTRVPRETFAGNLRNIVGQCRGVGAEVVLCTPNSIYAEDPRRPVKRLAEFAETVRSVARELGVPLVDCYATYEAIRAEDRRAWMLLMSETIHPSMNGHKCFAEEMARVISGRRVSLDDVRATEPCIPHTLSLLAKGKPVKLIAMPPYDAIVPRVLAAMNPAAKVEAIAWPCRGKTLAELEAWAKGVRNRKPDLVVVAVPGEIPVRDEERFIRSYSWVLNWSLSFGHAEWDQVVVLPSVTEPDDSTKRREAESLARSVAIGQDVGIIERSAGDTTPTEQLVRRWFEARQRSSRRTKGE